MAFPTGTATEILCGSAIKDAAFKVMQERVKAAGSGPISFGPKETFIADVSAALAGKVPESCASRIQIVAGDSFERATTKNK